MDGRLENAIGVLIFGLAVTGVFFVVALLVKLIFKKSIGTPKYYSTAPFLGAAIYIGILSTLPKPNTAQATVSVSGLDAPFIAPSKDKLESFPGQLDAAMKQLSPNDNTQFVEAMTFLTYAAADNARENEPAKFSTWDQKDIVAHSLNKMYNFARDQGDKMTLRKYIWLADEFKKQKPELLQRYTAEIKK